jgi:hypothetical protein
MSREGFVDQLARLVEKKIPLLVAFTGDQNYAFSHPRQFHDMVRPLDTRGRVDVAVYSYIDHAFSIPDDRRAFADAIAKWMAEKFPVPQSIR